MFLDNPLETEFTSASAVTGSWVSLLIGGDDGLKIRLHSQDSSVPSKRAERFFGDIVSSMALRCAASKSLKRAARSDGITPLLSK